MEARTELIDQLSTLGPTAWRVSVDSHAGNLVKSLQSSLRRVSESRPRQPRLSYVTPEILEALDRRKCLRRAIQGAADVVRNQALQVFLSYWTEHFCPSHSDLKTTAALGYPLGTLLCRHRRLATSIRRSLRAAKAKHCVDLAAKIRAGAFAGDSRALYHALKPFRAAGGGGQAARTRPTIRTAAGSLPKDTSEQNRIWEDHFGAIEKGVVVSPAAVLNSHAQMKPLPIQPQVLPTRLNFERNFRRLQSRKAPGHDGISHDHLKLAVPEFAQASFPLALKCAATSREPLRWKGGCVSPFYKLKGPTSDPNSFRSILVSETLG